MATTSNNSTSSDGDHETRTSPSIAISTVTGLVIGALCLFGIIISYQLLSSRWRLSAHKRSPTTLSTTSRSPPASAASKWHVWWTDVNASLESWTVGSAPPQVGSSANDSSTPRKRRFRSFILPSPSASAHQRDRKSTREKFATHFRLNLYPSSPSDIFSPRAKRNPYTPLDDSKFAVSPLNAVSTEKPPIAVVSPWSPCEDYYPYPTTPTPRHKKREGMMPLQMSSPLTPPPAYVPRTPLRGNISVSPHSPTPPTYISHATPRDVSASSMRTRTPEGEVDLTEIVVVDSSLRRRSDDGVFVICDELDADSEGGSVRWSNLSAVSI